MAKDMLDAIRHAEEECRLREQQAKQQAAERIQVAKKNAEALLQRRGQESKEASELQLSMQRREGDELLKKAKLEAQAQCDELSRTAEGNRPEVIRNAAKALLC